MTQNVYECLFILDSNRFARDPNAVDSQITEMIERRGGEVLISRRWNEQKLAFPINGHRKGTYWLSYFRIDPTEVVHFERACRLNDHVLRNLTVKVDERLVDTLVSHASGEKAAAEAEETRIKTAAKETAAKETAAKETAAKETAAKETAAEETATEETATEETATEETATEETATEETATEETAAKETAAKETAAKETATEETATEETATEETATEETATEETATEETDDADA